MIDKSHSLSKNINSSFSSLVDDTYDSLVLEKITKELFGQNKDIIDNLDEGSQQQNSTNDNRNILLAKCKGLLGLHFCENIHNFDLKLNDDVIVKIDEEFEFATIVEIGKMVSFKRVKLDLQNEKLPIIERHVSEKDIDRNLTNIVNSCEAKKVFLQLSNQLSLDMKLVDIHYQFDRKKLFFFYTSDGRVDFRELAKKLASTFKTRIELRQMGVRDEAKRLGGIATCGREFCCSSFINNFKRITTDIAEENNVTNSISKYTGPCGKLKCCLSFEIE